MAKIRTQRLDEACRKFCKHQGLPYGSDIEVRKNNGKGWKVRSDMQIIRLPFGKQISGDENISTMLDHFISKFTDPDFRSKNCKAILKTPYEGRINGNTLLSSVRDWNGLPTPDEIEQLEQEEFLIQATAEELNSILRDHEVDWNKKSVARSVVRALIRRYGKDLVNEALVTEGIC